MDACNLSELFGRFTEQWQPKKVAELNDYDVKIAKVQGEFVWHQHDDTDEFFLVVDGQLTIELANDDEVVLGPNELYVVPKGMRHCPRAEAETRIMLIEPRGVVNTGDAGGERTAELTLLD
jgi:mannose-6-phosphate isomerase-like protein (cupin superfamily)